LSISVLGGALAVSTGFPSVASARAPVRSPALDIDPALAEVAERVEQLMRDHAVPGVAVGLRIDGQEHSAGFGVTNVEYPRPVDGGTVFQVGSITKTFTGTAAAMLAERGLLDLDAPVRRYVPELVLADPDVAERITVRHLVTHSAGFFGGVLPNLDRNDEALAREVPELAGLPQLTQLGREFSYSNLGVCLEGRVVEVVGGKPYRDLLSSLILQPLGLRRSSFLVQDIVDYPVASGHVSGADGMQVERPFGSGIFTPAVAPIGGLFSTADDLLRWAAFHLGDGRTATGERMVAPETLANMQQPHGPGGADAWEDLDGVGVNWLLRTLDGVRIVQHSSDTATHHAKFLMAPERNFAFVMLTNSAGGSQLRKQLTPWVQEHFLGLREPSRPTITVSDADLAEYTGTYGVRGLTRDMRIVRADGELTMLRFGPDGALEPTTYNLRLYAPDRAVISSGDEDANLLDFLRSDDGRVSWVRHNGRVVERV
jgi:CubicO group peptidase (beta-lactamase class C family)